MIKTIFKILGLMKIFSNFASSQKLQIVPTSVYGQFIARLGLASFFEQTSHTQPSKITSTQWTQKSNFRQNQKFIPNKSTFPGLVCGHRGGVSPPVGPGGHIGKLLLSLQGLHLHKYYVYIFTGHIYIRQRRDDVQYLHEQLRPF